MELTIAQYLIVGIIQGITEWLPISSSGVLALIMTNFFDINNLDILLKSILFLHLGTFFAVLVYFRKDVIELFETLFAYRYQDERAKKTFKFLVITTIITGIIGFIILKLLIFFQGQLEFTGKTITFFVGVLLFFTGIIQIKIRNKGLKTEREIENSDSIFVGIAQGLSSLPGLSRSGITISTLLLKKFDDTIALRLSFLMSLPVVLLGNIFLNLKDLAFTSTAFYGLLASFIFGILTIHILMKLSRKINFGWFVLIFALLMMFSVLI